MWTLKCYIAGQDSGFRGWYDSQDPEIPAQIDVTLENLTALRDWDRTPLYDELRGRFEGLGEIRVDTDTASYRLLGFMSGRREFTILCGFWKLSNADYASECPKARNRKEGALKDDRRVSIWSVP